jgi:mycothiol synthase
MTTKTTFTARPYGGEADLQAICDMLNACDAVDQNDDNYAVDDLRVEFSDPRVDQARDLRVWEDGEGRVVGLGQSWFPENADPLNVYLYWRVLPEVRNQGLEDEIITWGEDHIREVARERGVAAAQIEGSARENYTHGQEALERHGLRPVRYFFRMARPLDAPIPEPQFPDGITLRHVVDDADAERWVEAFNLSFIDHWNHQPETVEAHKHWLTSATYRAERDLIAVTADNTVAGFCFCLIDPEANARDGRNEGWIDLLGTRRGFRKIGLGRALLLAGLHRLKADGVDTAILGVDAENPSGALRLYESVGFHKVYTTVAYCKDL